MYNGGAGVSINSKNGVFYKAHIWDLSFFISMQNWVFYNNSERPVDALAIENY